MPNHLAASEERAIEITIAITTVPPSIELSLTVK